MVGDGNGVVDDGEVEEGGEGGGGGVLPEEEDQPHLLLLASLLRLHFVVLQRDHVQNLGDRVGNGDLGKGVALLEPVHPGVLQEEGAHGKHSLQVLAIIK